MAPCRLALKAKTSCPKCCRPMSIKTLKYQHVCGRAWDVAKRAEEEAIKARAQAATDGREEKPMCATLVVQVD